MPDRLQAHGGLSLKPEIDEIALLFRYDESTEEIVPRYSLKMIEDYAVAREELMIAALPEGEGVSEQAIEPYQGFWVVGIGEKLPPQDKFDRARFEAERFLDILKRADQTLELRDFALELLVVTEQEASFLFAEDELGQAVELFNDALLNLPGAKLPPSLRSEKARISHCCRKVGRALREAEPVQGGTNEVKEVEEQADVSAPVMPQLDISKEEACQILGVSLKTLANMVSVARKSGNEYPWVKRVRGRAWIIARQRFEHWLNEESPKRRGRKPDRLRVD
ncbi:MAG: helix-turn-helix domain-containing protein [Planctomycetes bacterium]|nr:helix-turn-helix domain-containing protein [Planctomycetota bacterium]